MNNIISVLFFISSLMIGLSISQEQKLKTLPIKSSQIIKIGNSYSVTCLGDNFSDEEKKVLTDMKWMKDNVEIPKSTTGEEDVYTELGDGNIVLNIIDIEEEDNGEYTCEATFAGNVKLTVSQTLIVQQDITWADCQKDQNVVLGVEGKVQCIVEANPQAEIGWKFQNQNIGSNDKYILDQTGVTIKNVTLEDAGSYRIQAKVHETGNFAVRNILVTVMIPPTIVEPPTDVVAVEGKEAKFNCKVKGIPDPKITWTNKDGSDLSELSNDYVINQQTGELTINSPRKDDEGSFTCIAENNAGRRQAEAKLSVIIMAKIETFENVTADSGKTAVLTCISSGDPNPKITIKKLDSAYSTDDGRVKAETVGPDENGLMSHILTIKELSRIDDGLYVCISENEGGKVERIGHLTVQYAPILKKNTLGEVVAWNDNPVNITCVAESIPNATIQWYRSSIELRSGEKGYMIYEKNAVSILNIQKPDEQFYGNYLCSAQNPLGKEEMIINLKQVVEPGSPVGIKMDPITATTITISILPPQDGGSKITAYICKYRKQYETEWETKKWHAGSIPYILSELESSATYDLKFAAQNIVGVGQYYEVEPVTMPEKSSPEIPHLIGMEENVVKYSSYSNHFTIKWKIPFDNGERIDYFEINVFRVKNDSDSWKTLENFNPKKVDATSGYSNKYKLTDLEPNTYYKVEVRAHNQIGFSHPSSGVFHTTRATSLDFDNSRPVKQKDQKPSVSSSNVGMIVGIVLVIIVIALIVLDIICCQMKKCGVTLFISSKMNGGSDEKGKGFVEDGKVSQSDKGASNNGVQPEANLVMVVDEKEPLKNDEKANENQNEDSTFMNGEKAKENDAMDINNAEPEVKTPKDSAV